MTRKAFCGSVVVALASSVVCLNAWVSWWRQQAHARFVREHQIPGTLATVLRQDPELELFSLDPDKEHAVISGRSTFQGYVIQGSVRVAESAGREQLVEALRQATTPLWDGEGYGLCFEPRHGLRARDGAGEVWELVICFACSRAEIYHSGVLESELMLWWTGKPEEPFDRLLAQAGVEAAPEWAAQASQEHGYFEAVLPPRGR